MDRFHTGAIHLARCAALVKTVEWTDTEKKSMERYYGGLMRLELADCKRINAEKVAAIKLARCRGETHEIVKKELEANYEYAAIEEKVAHVMVMDAVGAMQMEIHYWGASEDRQDCRIQLHREIPQNIVVEILIGPLWRRP